MSELADLQRMLKARENKYGSATSVALIKERIADLEAPATIEPDALPPPAREVLTVRYRDAMTGHYVSQEYAEKHPDVTYKTRGTR